jgi:phosphohistidine swiveling domain-containing protein
METCSRSKIRGEITVVDFVEYSKLPVEDVFDELQEELIEHSKKGRGGIGDEGFRLNIALAQFGHLAAHYTHDKEVNSIARPFGTKEGEINDAGHALVQLMTYIAVRKIRLSDAMNMALVGLRSDDFIAKTAKPDEGLHGQVACEGYGNIMAFAFVDEHCSNLEKMPNGSILVANHPSCSITQHRGKIHGIVTDHGGIGCHAAIISREHGIPCIVGVVNATKKIQTGDILLLDVVRGTVTIKESAG